MSKKRESFFNASERVNTTPWPRDNDNSKKEEDREFARNEHPEDFDGTFSTAYMQTVELERKVNAVMSGLFEDYHGCILSVIPGAYGTNSIKVDLFFVPKRESVNENDDRRAFVTTEEKFNNPSNSNIINAIARNTMAAKKASAFELTNYAAEILWDFLPDDLTRKNGPGRKVDWRNPSSYRRADLISETVDNAGMGTQVIYSTVTGLDIIKLLAFIYGVKDPTSKSGILYNVTVDRPLSNIPTALGSNWLVTVTKMTWNDFHKAMNKLGINASRGSLPINTSKDEE